MSKIILKYGTSAFYGSVMNAISHDKSKALGTHQWVPDELKVGLRDGDPIYFLHQKEVTRDMAIEWLESNDAPASIIREVKAFPLALDYIGEAMGDYRL